MSIASDVKLMKESSVYLAASDIATRNKALALIAEGLMEAKENTKNIIVSI